MKTLCLTLCAAALGLAAAGCGGDDAASPTTTEKTTTTYPNIIVMPQRPVPPGRTVPAPPRRRTQADVVRIRIKGGKAVGGIVRARVKKGRPVLVVVRSDVADEVHVHGYDVKREITAGGTVRIPFTATIPGVFEVELEERGLQIAELTVR
jgi:hypothetical protein